MKNIYQIIIPALFSWPIVVSGSQEEEINYEFIHEDTYYSFRGSFYVNAESDDLMSLIYDFDNISEYALSAQSVELFQQGENWEYIKDGNPFRICYNIEENEWNGRISLQLNIKDIMPEPLDT